jgi:hypothetical protein
MPVYFFHQYLNGWLSARDEEGMDFVDQNEAIQHARRIVFDLLATHQSSKELTEGNSGAQAAPTNVCVEVRDATNTLSLIRGKVYAEAPLATAVENGKPLKSK